MVIEYATFWKQIGMNLEMDNNLLNTIGKCYPYDCLRCCNKMLSVWLDVTPNASWKMLYNAIKNIQIDLPCADKRSKTVMDKLLDTVETLWIAAGDVMIEQLSVQKILNQQLEFIRNLCMSGMYVGHIIIADNEHILILRITRLCS